MGTLKGSLSRFFFTLGLVFVLFLYPMALTIWLMLPSFLKPVWHRMMIQVEDNLNNIN